MGQSCATFAQRLLLWFPVTFYSMCKFHPFTLQGFSVLKQTQFIFVRSLYQNECLLTRGHESDVRVKSSKISYLLEAVSETMSSVPRMRGLKIVRENLYLRQDALPQILSLI